MEITPAVQWSQNLEGTFSYCVYEGTVTLDSVNDPQAFCIIPTTDLSFANMQSFEDDGINTYDLNPIKTPAGLFKDGAPYSCVSHLLHNRKMLDLIRLRVANNSQIKKVVILKNHLST